MTNPTIDLLWPQPRTGLDADAVAELYGRPGRELRDERPWIRANMVSTLDGAAMGADGRSGSISSPADRTVFHALRRLCDAVLVAAGTVRDEGYAAMRVGVTSGQARRAAGMTEHPVFVIASRSLALDPTSPIFTDAPQRPVIVTVATAPAARRTALARVADVVDCGAESIEAEALRAALAERGIHDVLCEGGPTFLGSLLVNGGIDELCLTLAGQRVVGNGPRIAHGDAESAAMRLAHVVRAGDDLMLRYVRSE